MAACKKGQEDSSLSSPSGNEDHLHKRPTQIQSTSQRNYLWSKYMIFFLFAVDKCNDHLMFHFCLSLLTLGAKHSVNNFSYDFHIQLSKFCFLNCACACSHQHSEEQDLTSLAPLKLNQGFQNYMQICQITSLLKNATSQWLLPHSPCAPSPLCCRSVPGTEDGHCSLSGVVVHEAGLCLLGVREEICLLLWGLHVASLCQATVAVKCIYLGWGRRRRVGRKPLKSHCTPLPSKREERHV